MDENYWVVINEEPTGPYTLEQAVGLIAGPDTPVWRPGLSDWQPAATVPELAAFMQPAAPVPPVPPVPVPPVAGPREEAAPAVPPAPAPAPAPEPEPQPAMPPTYMAWSIVVTVLCCLIPGIVAIVWSSRVSSAYAEGDYDRAARCSERAEWWIMIAIVAGLVSAPFSALIPMPWA